MVVKHGDKLFHFRLVKSPRYLVRAGFDVYTADTQSEISSLLDAFVSADDMDRVEIIQIASVQRYFNEYLPFFGNKQKGE